MQSSCFHSVPKKKIWSDLVGDVYQASERFFLHTFKMIDFQLCLILCVHGALGGSFSSLSKSLLVHLCPERRQFTFSRSSFSRDLQIALGSRNAYVRASIRTSRRAILDRFGTISRASENHFFHTSNDFLRFLL